MCFPAVSQYAESGPEDGSDDSDGTADVLVGNRPGRLSVEPPTVNRFKLRKTMLLKCDCSEIQLNIPWNTQICP